MVFKLPLDREDCILWVSFNVCAFAILLICSQRVSAWAQKCVSLQLFCVLVSESRYMACYLP